MERLLFLNMIGCLMISSLVTCILRTSGHNISDSVPVAGAEANTSLFNDTTSNVARSYHNKTTNGAGVLGVNQDNRKQLGIGANQTGSIGKSKQLLSASSINMKLSYPDLFGTDSGHWKPSGYQVQGNADYGLFKASRADPVPVANRMVSYRQARSRRATTFGYRDQPFRNATGIEPAAFVPVDGGAHNGSAPLTADSVPFLLDPKDNGAIMDHVTPTDVRTFLLDSTDPEPVNPLAMPPPGLGSRTDTPSAGIRNASRGDRRRKLYIGGLFELSGSYIYGRSELEAAKLAVKHINKQRFVPGYKLVLLHNDTRGDPGYGADAFYHFVYCKPQLVMLLGTSMSEVAKTLAEIVGYWNLLLVSYAATSPALSEREKYPTFYRLAPADSSYNAARKTFLQHFKWKTVAALHEDIETFTLAMNDMNKEFDKENITVKASLTFRTTGDDLQDKLKELKDEDARIIIGSFRENTARHVFCQAYHQGMYGQRYVWMISGSYRKNWWLYDSGDTNCTHEQLSEAVNGYFSVSSMNRILGNGRSISGYTTEEFLAEYKAQNVTSARSTYTQLTYDSLWTIALTLRKAMESWKRSRGRPRHRLDEFDYVTGTEMKNDFLRIMGSLDFIGVSGHISFDGPDRQSVIVIEQNQGGTQKKIGMFNPENATLDMQCIDCEAVVWPDGRVPADQFTKVVRLEYIQPEAFYTVSAVACFGIYLAIVFLSFNLHHRKLRYIKLSSPKLNNVAVAGCILVYLAVILLGMDDAILGHDAFAYICTARAFLLAAGFSLAFGAMFTKTYRVHQIFRGCHSGLVKSKMLKDKQLLFIIITLLILDAAIISLWITIDPMERTVTNFTVEPSPEHKDLLIIPQLSKCDSRHMTKWTGVMYAYKGLLLLFGVYMAWETRHVKIPALNDSRYIGLNIYNVVLSSVTVVALSNLISDRPTLSYSLVAALIILSTTIMLCLLFLPKIYAIIKHNGAPVVATSGLTVEANTRRFVVDEKRELYYRAEVQNRVYKRELIELDQEITRLERILEVSNATVYDDFLSLIDGKKDDNDDVSDLADHEIQKHDQSPKGSNDVISVTDLPSVSISGPCVNNQSDPDFSSLVFESSNCQPAPDSRRFANDQDCVSDVNHSNPGSGAAEPGSGATNYSNHAGVNTNMRCQNDVTGRSTGDGMTSVLYNGQTEVVGEKTYNENCDSNKSDRTINANTAPPNGEQQQQQSDRDDVTGSYVTGQHLGVTGSGQPENKKRHRLAKERADMLKRELARIQQELKSLGELELEVSYV